MATNDDLIGNAAAAAHVGLGLDTWRPYVARGQAPAPYRREVKGGHALPVWHRADLDEWMAARPGQGKRTDLGRSDEGDQGGALPPSPA